MESSIKEVHIFFRDHEDFPQAGDLIADHTERR